MVINKFRKYLYIFFLLIVSNSNGQGFKGYVFAGVSTSQVAGDALSGFNKAGIDFGAGVFTTITKNNKNMMGMEIGFIQKGSRRPSNLAQGDISSYNLRLDYLEIPLYYKYAITSKFQVYAGGSIGVLTNSYEERDGIVYIKRSDPQFSDVVLFNKFDFSAIGGLEYFLTGEWHLNLRGLQSLVPAREFGGRVPNTAYHSGQFNNVLAFTINYKFKSKEKNGESEK